MIDMMIAAENLPSNNEDPLPPRVFGHEHTEVLYSHLCHEKLECSSLVGHVIGGSFFRESREQTAKKVTSTDFFHYSRMTP